MYNRVFYMTQKNQLHVSGLNLLSKCGIAFENRYIRKLPSKPSIPLIVGTATHATVRQNLTKKKDTGELMHPAEVLDIARDELVHEWDKTDGALETDEDMVVYGPAKAKAMAIDKAVRLSGLHRQNVAPQILKPTHLERQWVLDIEGFQFELAGAIDVQEETADGTVIRDTKTSGKSPSATVADQSSQLSMYALALYRFEGKLPASLTLDYLIDNKTPVTKSYTTKRELDDFAPLMRRVEAATRVIESGHFQPANEDDWICGPKYCSYWSSCAYVRHPKSVLVNIGG